MANRNIDLNDNDMWDDSALVDSWNEALDEYKKYHSIHAKGGSIKQLQALSASKKSTTAEAVPASDGMTMEEADHNSTLDESKDQKPEASTREAAGAVPAIAPPQAVLGTVQDENLKKLLMSWYYAGYYTGLYEGQQQQQQQQPQPQ